MPFPAPIPPCVLLVEQDEELIDLFASLFQAQGYRVSTARGAFEALDCAGDAPDVIFSSLVFRDMNGFELCRRLRRLPQTANSLIVALTGYCETGIQQKVAEAGFDDYLLKPAPLQSLLELVKAHLRRRTAHPMQPGARHREPRAAARMVSASR